MEAVICEQLSKSYHGTDAIREVDLTVEEGEKFAFLGPNGAGKSTTVGILSTLLRPTGGWAEVAGFDVEFQAAEVRNRIGVVFQEQAIDNDLTAAENMLFHGVLYGVPKAQARARADRLLDLMGLGDRRDARAVTFSGGLRRRLEVARCLMHEPRLLFLDEPTAGLDPHARALVWELLEHLRRDTGMTLFLTTHYLAEAEGCDQVAIIDQGNIVAAGTPTELKGRIGADIVQFRTDNDPLAATQARQRLGLDVTESTDGLRIHTPGGPQLVPWLCTELDVSVTSISVSAPSLEDVFMHHTGRTFDQGD